MNEKYYIAYNQNRLICVSKDFQEVYQSTVETTEGSIITSITIPENITDKVAYIKPIIEKLIEEELCKHC